LREPLGIVHILIARHAAVDRLAHQVRQGKLGVLPTPRVAQVLGNQITETQTFIQFADHNQASVGGDP
jgi:hypothetical protein